jgi:hypothetical protein
MRDVELVEGDERAGAVSIGATTPASAEASPGDRSSRWRRARRWWLLVGVLVVVLVAVSIVQDRRDQARLVRLAAVPGVLAPVGGPVHGLWTTTVATTAAITDVHDVGGVLVGGWTSPDGGSAARGVDARTGGEVWSVPLAAAGVPSWGCVTTQGPVTGQSPVVLVCEVVDASATELLGTTTSTHAAAVHVVVTATSRTPTISARLATSGTSCENRSGRSRGQPLNPHGALVFCGSMWSWSALESRRGTFLSSWPSSWWSLVG